MIAADIGIAGAPTPEPGESHSRGVISAGDLQHLIQVLAHEGYCVIGPVVRDGGIVYDRINGASDLPAGWHDEQEAGRFRLKRDSDPRFFAFVPGAGSWKPLLHPAEAKLWTAERSDGTFRILDNEKPLLRYAFLGVRACELAAIALQDRVLLADKYSDRIYEASRKNVFVVAVQCSQSAPTCFCSSMGTGPRVTRGFDLLLTELLGNGGHRMLVESGSVRGGTIFRKLNIKPASEQDIKDAEASSDAATHQTRVVDTSRIKEALSQNFEHPRWDDVAMRCLTCANCTMVCPTCFCTTIEDSSDISGTHAEHWRRWDSCFTLNFSYIHGGSVRTTSRARYRQWLTHKFASWYDQFGSSGCVGCGRCITWCPAGIDVTQEIRALCEGGPNGDS
jgi:ferredoxin